MLENNRSEESSNGFLRRHPKLKIALSVLYLTALFLFITLLFVGIAPGGSTCNSDACIHLANKLKDSMNFSAHPCDDFYQFSCGNAFKDKSLKNIYVEMEEYNRQDLINLYKKDIKDNDHEMVKFAMRLFKKCVNEDDIEKEGLKSIKDAIKAVGGWPILDNGNRTKGTKVNWIQIIYKLRELGYPFLFFFNLEPKTSPDNKEEFYLQITMGGKPDENKFIKKHSKSKAIEIMTEVARLFGAKDENLIKKEMRDAYEFWMHLNISYYMNIPHEKYTVAQYQKIYDEERKVGFNWLEFLNQLLGSHIVLFSNDYVLFQNPSAVARWINEISATSQRTIKNVIIWKVIEAQLQYLPKKVKNIVNYTMNDTREKFCLKETETRFLISPMEILNTRAQFSEEKKKEMLEIFSDTKSELLDLLDKAHWLEENDKNIVKEKTKTLTLIYGLAGDYFNDTMLDDMDVDLVKTKTDTFLDLLAQANRNFQTTLFNQISSNTLSKFYTRNKNTLATFQSTENELEFGLLQEQMSQQTVAARKQIFECLEEQMKKQGLAVKDYEVIILGMVSAVADKLSYETYKKWMQSHGREPKLPKLDYTPRQLFWIANSYCNVPDISIDYELDIDISGYGIDYYYSVITEIAIFNNPYFARDFNCPRGSQMNPTFKCLQWL